MRSRVKYIKIIKKESRMFETTNLQAIVTIVMQLIGKSNFTTTMSITFSMSKPMAFLIFQVDFYDDQNQDLKKNENIDSHF